MFDRFATNIDSKDVSSIRLLFYHRSREASLTTNLKYVVCFLDEPLNRLPIFRDSHGTEDPNTIRTRPPIWQPKDSAQLGRNLWLFALAQPLLSDCCRVMELARVVSEGSALHNYGLERRKGSRKLTNESNSIKCAISTKN
mmetsp:Transcript_19529/g.45646  ORF Transcript_19529/g.45646 Transcript_19529/m.45646 type:complete len:141 (-) Transcript_19529:514-936(-)